MDSDPAAAEEFEFVVAHGVAQELRVTESQACGLVNRYAEEVSGALGDASPFDDLARVAVDAVVGAFHDEAHSTYGVLPAWGAA